MNTDLGTRPLKYLAENLSVALGLVLIWRSMWYGLDAIDLYLFDGSRVVTIVCGIIFGVLVLYIPHRNLKALERL